MKIISVLNKEAARCFFQRHPHINRHLSISMMAVFFVGSNLITSNANADINLAQLFPPTPDVVEAIAKDIGKFTPTINEDGAPIAKAYSNSGNNIGITASIIAVAQAADNTSDEQGFEYTIEKGDTWSKVAQKFNLKTSSVLIFNGIDSDRIKKDPTVLKLDVDKVIKIPGNDINGGPADWVQLSNDIAQKEQQKQQALNDKKKSTSTKLNGKRINTNSAVASGNYDMTSYGGFAGGWCTAGVAKYRPDIRSPFGHAKQWYSTAQSRGFQVGQNPEVGAVVATRENGTYGHVAYVTGVSGDTISVIEMNYESFGRYSTRTFNPKTSGVLIGYIYK